MSGPGVLTLSHVSKRIGNEHVLHDVSFRTTPGEIILVVGANGAGKSTLLRVIAGLLRADAGSVAFDGQSGGIGYSGHALSLYTEFTVLENLQLFSRLLGRALSSEVLEQWQLSRVRDRRVSQLSKGEGARASLARALLGDPELLLLDEPTSALDDASVELLRSVVTGVRAANRTAILVSHDIERIAPVASRVLVLARGRIVQDATAAECAQALDAYRKGNR